MAKKEEPTLGKKGPGAGSVIKKCSCEHQGQDELYGTYYRVQNYTQQKNGNATRCTVCGRVS